MGLLSKIKTGAMKRYRSWEASEKKKNAIYQKSFENEEVKQIKAKARRDAKSAYKPKKKKRGDYINDPFGGL